MQEFQSFTADWPDAYQPDLAEVNGALLLNGRGAPPRRCSADVHGKVTFETLPEARAGQKYLPGKDGDYFVVDSSGLLLVSKNGSFDLGIMLVPGYENVVVLPGGDYLFCLEDGFARLDRARLETLINDSLRKPAPMIRGIFSTKGEWLGRGGPDDKPVFPWQQNGLRFQFALPDFTVEPHFSWRLDGFLPEWSPWQRNAEKEFTNLPPGRYTLRLRSAANGPETSLSFRIAPPWYRSGWGWALYAGLALAALWGLEKINRRRLRRQRRHLMTEQARDLASQRTEAEREKLTLEIENKSRELSNAALNLIRKNEVLQHLKDQLLGLGQDPQGLSKIVRLIDRHLESDHDWELFEVSFNRVHDDFFKRLLRDYPELTQGDLRLAAYLKMNLSSKEIAPLLNISIRGVENKRYRLRKKLGLPEDGNLAEFMIGY